MSENLSVSSEVPDRQHIRSQVSDTAQAIESLPLNGRNYLDLALLLPAVSRTNTGSNQRFAETSAVPGTGISVAGQRNLNNGFIVDGLSANDDAADLAGTFYSQEVIREFQVVTSGGIAQFGRASAALSTSSLNRERKTGEAELRLPTQPATRRQEPARTRAKRSDTDPVRSSIGGPLLPESNLSLLQLRADPEERFAGDHHFAGQRGGDQWPAQPDRLCRARGSKPESFPEGSTRPTCLPAWIISMNHLTSFRRGTALYDISALNSAHGGRAQLRSAAEPIWTTAIRRSRSAASRRCLTAPSTKRVSNTLAAVCKPRPMTWSGPAVNISGVASFGTATFSPVGRDIDLYEVVDNIATQTAACTRSKPASTSCTIESTYSFPAHFRESTLSRRLPTF